MFPYRLPRPAILSTTMIILWQYVGLVADVGKHASEWHVKCWAGVAAWPSPTRPAREASGAARRRSFSLAGVKTWAFAMSAAGGLSLRDGDRLRRCRLRRGYAIGSTRSLMLTIGSTTVAFVEAVRHRLRRGHALAFVEVMRSPSSRSCARLRRGHALAFVEVMRSPSSRSCAIT